MLAMRPTGDMDVHCAPDAAFADADAAAESLAT